ncbi:MAG TPA: SDR family NAD(P)-dependent oxidoreductase [Burkholderiales bacterium]|nr:SDR family NAD(P)-dependent oxidoreductase [Burkholderiales bacterium]
MDVAGRTAFITGGANGIGLGIARAFARAGAKLALADVDAAALASARAELAKETQVESFVLDVRDREAYARTADAAEAALGPVSLLFNNAGVALAVPAETMSYESWDFALGVNLGGVVNGLQTFVPRMLARSRALGGGHVVNTSSGAGLVAPGSGFLYHTAKFAVVGLSESLRFELAGAGIGVSVLCPGPVATRIMHHTLRSQPASSPRPAEQMVAAVDAFLNAGVAPDAVGEMVLRGVRDGALYIHTDRIVEAALQARTRALLDALPRL